MKLLDGFDLPLNPRIFVLAPHPDDEVFGCGGLTALLSTSSASIQIDIVTDGGFGHHGMDVQQRKAESRAAATVLGYPEPFFWDLPDQGLRFDQALTDRIVARINDVRPDLILLPSPWEIHQDHLAVANAGIEALRILNCPAIQVLFYEVGAPLQANCLLDITSVEERKLRAMACFESQLKIQHYDRHIRGLNNYRTYTLGTDARSAEAFYRPDSTFLKFGGVNIQSLVPRVNTDTLKPAVDILIRTTNRPELHQAVHSVVGQTYPNVRAIVLDVGAVQPISSEELPVAISIRVIEGGGRIGRATAANLLLAESDAPYVLFLDDDDWLLPRHIENLVKALEAAPDAVAAYADTVCLEQQDGQWNEIRRFTGTVETQRLAFENRLPIHAVLFRRGVVEQHRFDPAFDLFEDWDWWLQVSGCGSLVHVAEVGAIYRIHASGGLGVRADDGRALIALDQVIQKWHVGARPEILRERLAYVRQLLLALDNEQSSATKLRETIDELKRGEARSWEQHTAMQKSYEETLNLRDRQIGANLQYIHQLQADIQDISDDKQQTTGQLVELQSELLRLGTERDRLAAELNEERQQLARIHTSRSWQVTRLARGSARVVRRLVGKEPKQSEGGQLAMLISLRQKILQNVRMSPLARWVYYRLPMSESQRFRLRTWGRGAIHQLAVHSEIHQEPASSGPNTAIGKQAFLELRLPGRLANIDSPPLPTISVVIPCFNQGQFLTDSIASAYAAYSGQLEIIVINDGSTEPLTLRCLSEIALLYPEVRIIHQENCGLSAARNAGIGEARGEYIQFLDADDLLVPGKLDVQLCHAVQEELDVSICNYLITDATLREMAKTDETIANHASYQLEDILFKWERTLSIPIHCGLFAKRIFEEIRFNTTLHAKEDWVFWCSITRAGFVPAYIDFHGAVYRMHEGSMRRSFVRMARQWMQAVAYLDQIVADEYPDFFEESIRWVNQYYRSNPIYQDEICNISKLK